MELEAFLAGLGLEPDDWLLRSVTADWCEENGLSRRADCLRWMVRHKKRPYRGSSGAAVWFNGELLKGEMGDVESDAPGPVFERLEGGEDFSNHKTFPSLRAAEEAFHAAWATAVEAGWAADG